MSRAFMKITIPLIRGTDYTPFIRSPPSRSGKTRMPRGIAPTYHNHEHITAATISYDEGKVLPFKEQQVRPGPDLTEAERSFNRYIISVLILIFRTWTRQDKLISSVAAVPARLRIGAQRAAAAVPAGSRRRQGRHRHRQRHRQR